MTSRILPRLWTACLALATAVLGPQRLPAHSAAAAADARPVTSPRVEVSLVGSVAQDPEFRKLVEEWLGANDVAHVTRSLDSLELDDITRAHDAGPPVRIWVLAPSAERLRIYLAEPRAQRYLFRDVALPSGLDELGRERSAQAVLSTALAFMNHRADSTLGELERAFEAPVRPRVAAPPRARQAPSRSEPPPTRRQTRRGSVGYGAGASYSVSHATELLHGPGGLLFVELPARPWSIRAVARGLCRWQRPIDTPRVRVSELDVPFSASGAALWPFHSGWSIHLELGAGIDLARMTPEAVTSSGVAPRARRWASRPFGLALLGIEGRAGSVAVGVFARLDWALIRTHYDVQTESGLVREFTRPLAQPGLVLDLVWSKDSRG